MTVTYDFKSFCDGKLKIKNKKINKKNYLFSVSPFTLGGLLTLSPLMKVGVGVILGFGALTIFGSYIESRLAFDHEEYGELLRKGISVVIVSSIVVGMFILFFHNPIWR